MKIAIASDHAGFALKEILIETLKQSGHEILNLGTDSQDSVDYPDFGERLAKEILAGHAERGILICGTGIGISIAANRHKGVRAAVCHDVTSARMTRLHNDANVICLGERLIGVSVAQDCVNVFLTTEFEGGRHSRRVEKLG